MNSPRPQIISVITLWQIFFFLNFTHKLGCGWNIIHIAVYDFTDEGACLSLFLRNLWIMYLQTQESHTEYLECIEQYSQRFVV